MLRRIFHLYNMIYKCPILCFKRYYHRTVKNKFWNLDGQVQRPSLAPEQMIEIPCLCFYHVSIITHFTLHHCRQVKSVMHTYACVYVVYMQIHTRTHRYLLKVYLKKKSCKHSFVLTKRDLWRAMYL